MVIIRVLAREEEQLPRRDRLACSTCHNRGNLIINTTQVFNSQVT
jgi:hypothetical protein